MTEHKMDDESARTNPESQPILEESMRQAMDRLTQRNLELGGELCLDIGYQDTRALIFPTPVESQIQFGNMSIKTRNYLLVTRDGFQAIQISDPEESGKLSSARVWGAIDHVKSNPDSYRGSGEAGYRSTFIREGLHPHLSLKKIVVDDRSLRAPNALTLEGPDDSTTLTGNLSVELIEEIIIKNKDRAQSIIDEKRRMEEEARKPERVTRRVLQDLDNLLA